MTETAAATEVVQEKTSTSDTNMANLRRQAQQAQQMADQERTERMRLQQEIEELKQSKSAARVEDDESEDFGDEPYVESKKFKSILKKRDERLVAETEQRMRGIIQEEHSKNYMNRLRSEYPDFSEVCSDESLNRLEQVAPAMAEKLLKMKDPYEQRSMAYLAIKTAGLHKKQEPDKPSMQAQIDNNPRRMYYTPNTASASATAMMGDFSDAGKKQAYEKVKALAKQVGGRR